MPLSDALPAACCCCVLGNKYWMSTHWCLFTIICYICRSFSLCNKILCMLSYCIQVSSLDSVVAPATQGRPLDDRNLFHLCNQCPSALNESCFGGGVTYPYRNLCFRWKLLRNLELSSRSNNCLYHSSFVIKTSLLPAHV